MAEHVCSGSSLPQASACEIREIASIGKRNLLQ
jgi:hypothetical protein